MTTWLGCQSMPASKGDGLRRSRVRFTIGMPSFSACEQVYHLPLPPGNTMTRSGLSSFSIRRLRNRAERTNYRVNMDLVWSFLDMPEDGYGDRKSESRATPTWSA